MSIQTRSRRSATLTLLLIIPLFTASFAAKCGGGANNNNKTDNVNGLPKEIGKKVDDQLGREIRRLISKNERSVAGLSGLDLHVFCVNRKVSITGTVGTDAARDEAIRIARETEVEVEGQKYKAEGEPDVSQFTVKPTASTSPSPTASPSP
jgi:osmotically-inducible protein OsmY